MNLRNRVGEKWRVETMGLEPTTPCLQSRCSSQLSYVPEGLPHNSRLLLPERSLTTEPIRRPTVLP
ncbi:MAG: hypothetical protein RL547_1721 [Actinomycetota bacterium]